MTSATKHIYEVTTATGHKERIRAEPCDIADQIVIFDVKSAKGGVAAFPCTSSIPLRARLLAAVRRTCGRGSRPGRGCPTPAQDTHPPAGVTDR